MIWILTTHPTDEWISIQKRHLSACLPQDEYRVIAVVPDGARGSFDIEISDTAKNVEPSPAHQKNLSALTRRLVEESPKPDDVLIVLDGDAFPVCPMSSKIRAWVENLPLVTIELTQRLKKNYTEKMINCAFMVCKWQFFTQRFLKVGWRPTQHPGCRDTNGAMNLRLWKLGIDITRLRRSNIVEPLWPYFGIYGGCVYHNGIGFRGPPIRPRERRAGHDFFGPDAKNYEKVVYDYKLGVLRLMQKKIARDTNFWKSLI